MSIIGSNILAGAAGSGVSAYEIEQSLRFDGGSYLNRTPGSAGNRRTCTLSFWFKWASQGGEGVFLWASGRTKLAIDPGGFDALSLDDYDGSYNIRKLTTQSLRDPSAWYHAVVVMDTTNATAGDRHRLYLNGERVTAFSTSTDSGQNFDTEWNNNVEHRIGADNNPFYFRGYIAEMHMLDGTAVTNAEDFGELDNNGVWRPIEYTGSYGTNGFYLKFDPTATNGIGHDHSGNGNNFSPNGFTTSGTGTDVMSDTPTNNFATLNAAYTPNDMSFADGNLYFAPTTSGWRSAQSTIGVTGSGKYYCEMKLSSINSARIALTSIQDTDLFNVGATSYTNNGVIVDADGNQITSGASWTSGDVMALAIDMDNGSVAYYKNGSLQQTVTGLDTSKHWRPAILAYTSSTNGYFNFGQRAFEQTPPTGFNPISTSNLPAPDIADGSDYFNTVTYTGNGSTQSITGVGFQPDWLWIKARNASYHHTLTDAVRGTNKQLWSNRTNEEQTNSTFVTSFDSDGFSLGDESVNGSGSVNTNNTTFVAWNWLAGNGTSSNTDGSVTSTVSANPSAGFSIVSYTASGTDNDTVGHGLGVQPSFHIVKSRDGARDWLAYTREIDGSLDFLRLNTTAAAANSSANAPTSTVFSIYGADINTAGEDCIAYCFAEVEGYSKFGSYTGGIANLFIYTGFKPAFLLIKSSNESSDWVIMDTARSPYNLADEELNPNSSRAERSDAYIDIVSNGFVLKNGAAATNAYQHIFAAFASSPFGGSGVSPATAR